MANYTKLDVINELRALYAGPKKRDRELTDRRFYIIGILYFEFKMLEKDILPYTNLNSLSSINHAKKNCYLLYHGNDPFFLANVEDLIKKYPYDFIKTSGAVKPKNRLEIVRFAVTPSIMAQLKKFTDKKGFKSPNIGAQYIVKNLLKIWEE
jgi:hypothetical protein